MQEEILVFVEPKNLPASLDDHICSVELSTPTNDLEDGYILQLSAFFGSDAIELIIDGEIVPVGMRINKAEIILRTHNCHFEGSYSPPEFSRLDPLRNDKLENNSSSKFSVRTESLPFLTASYERESSHHEKNGYRLSLVNSYCVSIERECEKGLCLSGRLIDRFAGWKIIPNKNEPSAVIACARVRAPWIEFSDHELNYAGSVMGQIFKNIWHGKDVESKRRRKYFPALLAKLVSIGLQKNSVTKEANLAFDGLFLYPDSHRLVRSQRGINTGRVLINGDIIRSFLQCSEGAEEDFIRNIDESGNFLAANDTKANKKNRENQSESEILVLERILGVYLRSLKLSKVIQKAGGETLIGRLLWESINLKDFSSVDAKSVALLEETRISISKNQAAKLFSVDRKHVLGAVYSQRNLNKKTTSIRTFKSTAVTLFTSGEKYEDAISSLNLAALKAIEPMGIREHKFVGDY